MTVSPDVQRLKIVFYTRGSDFNGNTIDQKGLGGSESALLYIARELARRGHMVSVFCTCSQPGNYQGVEYRHSDGFLPYCNAHPQDVGVFSRLYEPLVQANSKIKILWLHDVAGSKYYTAALPELDRYVQRYFVISAWQRQGFIDTFRFDASRFYLTRNGVDLELFEGSPPRNRFKLIYINTPFRGLDVLVNLFPFLRQAVPEVELHLYTGMSLYGGQFMEWEEQLRGLYDHARKMPGVHLCEPLPKAELANELLTSGLSLYPSHFEECCSIASLEVQAAGVPMITSDLAGLKDTIKNGETGILIPIDNKELKSRSQQYQINFLNQAVRLLRDEDAWRALSMNASRNIRDNYSWSRIAMEWEKEFSELLGD
jgi:glycosyltransferase involved in cell wall biosynthesis